MIAKRYFSALIILITFLGFYKKQSLVPNQEIELQFENQVTVFNETEDVIQAIKQQLVVLGVENIQVRQTPGTLKIAYYSDANVAEIKKILAAEGFTSNHPSEETPTNPKAVKFQGNATADHFKIDVYELQTASNPYAAIHGKYILVVQKDFDKSPTSNPNSFANTSSFYLGDIKTVIALAYTESSYTAIPKESIPHEIPDVRAGPSTTILSYI